MKVYIYVYVRVRCIQNGGLAKRRKALENRTSVNRTRSEILIRASYTSMYQVNFYINLQ